VYIRHSHLAWRAAKINRIKKGRMMKRLIIVLAISWVFMALAPGAVAAPEGIQLAQSNDDAMRRELQRLRDERQRLRNKAIPSGKTRARKRSAQPAAQPSKRMTLTLPPGWSDGEVPADFKEAAIGNTPGFSKARSEMMASVPADASAEIIVAERFNKSKVMSLEHVYQRWRDNVNAGCSGGREIGPDDAKQDGQAVIDSFYACPNRNADGRAEVSMLKVIGGAAELFSVSRVWLGPSLGTAKTPDMDSVIDDWTDWSKTAVTSAAAKVAPTSRAPNGEKVSQGYAIVVSRSGHIVTLHSFIEDCGGVRFSSLPAEKVASDANKVLTLFKLNSRPKAVATFRKGLEAARGDTVALPSFMAGAGNDLSVTTGVINALIGPGGDPRFLSVTTAIQPGNSGLPLVDLRGSIAGMAVSRAKAMAISSSPPGVPAKANFALSAKMLRGFLDRQGVVCETKGSGAIMTPGDAEARARTATVLVECRN